MALFSTASRHDVRTAWIGSPLCKRSVECTSPMTVGSGRDMREKRPWRDYANAVPLAARVWNFSNVPLFWLALACFRISSQHTRILESDSMQPTIPSADSPTPTASKVERAAGTTFLPIARVKRIIKEDKDVSLINAEATFCVAYATVCSLLWLAFTTFFFFIHFPFRTHRHCISTRRNCSWNILPMRALQRPRKRREKLYIIKI
jgi:hypothetical protein